jgi:hypothetical protein
MKKTICIVIFVLISVAIFAQERKLKYPQPGVALLMHFQIRLNPNDTIFNNVDFSYLPVKNFPFFTADPKIPMLTIHQRDSVIRRVDALFFE